MGKSNPESCDLTGGLGYGPLVGNAALSARCFFIASFIVVKDEPCFNGVKYEYG